MPNFLYLPLTCALCDAAQRPSVFHVSWSRPPCAIPKGRESTVLLAEVTAAVKQL